VPRLCEFYPGICLTTEEKAWKNLSQSKKNLSQVKRNLSQSTVYILPKNNHTLQNPHEHTHYKTHSYTHTLQNNIKPPQDKLKKKTYRKSNIMGEKSTYFLMLLILRYSTPFLTGPSLHFTALHLTSLHFTNHKYPSQYTPI